MAGMMKRDDSGGTHVPLMTSREPKGPTVPGGKGTTGDEAFKDAVFLVACAWVVLFILCFSLRTHSV
jgi:hypothetical protein